jgi:hypothetical protein
VTSSTSKLLIAIIFTAWLASCFNAWSQPWVSVENKTFQQPTTTFKQGTEQSPTVVKILPEPNAATDASKDREERRKNDQWLIIIGGAQLVVFFFQLLVFGYQALKLRQTVKGSAESLEEATRAANAMEMFAQSAAVASKAATEGVTTNKDTMTRLLRAYLCVNFGGAAFQIPGSDFKFEVNLQLINVGQTPGYRVGYKARADVLPFPLPPEFAFELPDTPNSSESTVGHAQSIILTAVVDRICSGDEVAEIRAGSKRLYILGTATYEDVYRLFRYTNFCFSVIWLPNGNAMGIFTKRFNDAD